MSERRKTAALLLALTLVFSAGTVLLMPGRGKEEAAEKKKVYYLTGYENADQVLAVQVENESGMLTMVRMDGGYITDTDMTGIGPDEERVSDLFARVCQIRVSQPLEGADAADEQFGLKTPAAQILVQDVQEGGISFLIGERTPDSLSRYVAAEGGSEVYTISADYDDIFLCDIRRYLDLRVFAGVDFSKVTDITLKDESGVRYALQQTGVSEVTGALYYNLKEPACLPLALSLMQEHLLTPMQELRAVRAAAEGGDEAHGDKEVLTEQKKETGESAATAEKRAELIIKSAQGGSLVYEIAWEEKGPVLVRDSARHLTFMLEDTPAWLGADAADLLGGNLLTVQSSALDEVTLEMDGKTARFGSDEEEAWTQLTEDLNRIPIQINKNGDEPAGAPVLRCALSLKREEEKRELAFFEGEERTCLVSVNGKCAFTCPLTSVQALMRDASP